jgi:hypothetical protein
VSDENGPRASDAGPGQVVHHHGATTQRPCTAPQSLKQESEPESDEWVSMWRKHFYPREEGKR